MPLSCRPFRARRHNMTEPIEINANSTRPRREIQWQRKISATRTVTETRAVYADVTQIDALLTVGLLDAREARAALRLYGLFLAAGLSPRVTPRQDTVADEPEDISDDLAGDIPVEDARGIYRALLVGLGGDRGPVLDARVDGDRDGGAPGAGAGTEGSAGDLFSTEASGEPDYAAAAHWGRDALSGLPLDGRTLDDRY